MKTLGKLFAKNLRMLAIIVVLLFAQAYCDLSLPQVTSDMINVGLGQKGMEFAVPDKIKEQDFDKILSVLNFAGKSDDANYTVGQYTGSNNIYSLKLSDSQGLRVLEEKLEFPEAVLALSAQRKIDVFSTSANAGAANTEIKSTFISAVNKLDPSIRKQMAMQYAAKVSADAGADLSGRQKEYMLNTGVIMVLFSAGAMVTGIFIRLFASRTGAVFAKDMRTSVFKKVLTFSSRELDTFSSASLITRCTNDIQQIQMVLIMVLSLIFYAPILGFGALYKALSADTHLVWIIGVCLGAMTIVVVLLFISVFPKFKIIQNFVDKLNLVSKEILTGIPVIRAFAREEHEKKRFDIANIDLTKVNIFVNRVMAAMMPILMLVTNAACILIIGAGSHAVDAGELQIGGLMAFIGYTMLIIVSFMMLTMMSIVLPRAVVSLKRIAEVLDVTPEIADPATPVRFSEAKKGEVEFKAVTFRYPGADEDVLRNISFVSEKGKTTAIIGSTGSGKSTLANLILRFFDVTSGQILVDGTDIRNVTLRDLRNKIGYVPQKAVLLSGTVTENIAYAATADAVITPEVIKKAAEISQSAQFINEHPDGYDREISQGGGNVSGGQKQRLSIARAIAKRPEIFIFDDSFSALDYKTDINLRRALNEVTRDSAVIIIAQRISTVLKADRIIVLDNGEIAGMGKHGELMETCETYRDIAYSQLSAKELESGQTKNQVAGKEIA